MGEKEKKPKLLIKIEGIPRGRLQSEKHFTRSSSVEGGMYNIAAREGLINRQRINKELGLIFRNCTISHKELPNGRWKTTSPDE